MTNLTPTRLSPSAARVSSLTKEGATKPETPTLGNKKASPGASPEARLSLGKKVWHFLTLYNLRHRVRSPQGGVGTRLQAGGTPTPRLNKKPPSLFSVPKGLFFGSSMRPVANRAEPNTIETAPQAEAKTDKVGKSQLDTAQQVLDRIDARYTDKGYKLKATQLATSNNPKVRAEHDKFNEHKETIRQIANPRLNKLRKNLLPEEQRRVDELFSAMDEIIGLPSFDRQQQGQRKET